MVAVLQRNSRGLQQDFSNSVLIQWFTFVGTGKNTVTLPRSFTSLNYTPVVIVSGYKSGNNSVAANVALVCIENTSEGKITQYFESNIPRRFIAVGY